MNKVLITGARGTVGRALWAQADKQGITVIAWDRERCPVLDKKAAENLLDKENPDAFYHLAIASKSTGMVNEGFKVNRAWPEQLAALCARRSIPFVFSSTVMVYSEKVNGPYTIKSRASATDGYGLEKLQAEEAVRRTNPKARIARLGWQIGQRPGSNNMVDFLFNHAGSKGPLKASRKWLPACSFLQDTASALLALASMKPSVYLLDANKKWNFFQIISALNEAHGSPARIAADDSFIYDQRMVDVRLKVKALEEHLPQLLEL